VLTKKYGDVEAEKILGIKHLPRHQYFDISLPKTQEELAAEKPKTYKEMKAEEDVVI
jgi:hypothetical protein